MLQSHARSRKELNSFHEFSTFPNDNVFFHCKSHRMYINSKELIGTLKGFYIKKKRIIT